MYVKCFIGRTSPYSSIVHVCRYLLQFYHIIRHIQGKSHVHLGRTEHCCLFHLHVHMKCKSNVPLVVRRHIAQLYMYIVTYDNYITYLDIYKVSHTFIYDGTEHSYYSNLGMHTYFQSKESLVVRRTLGGKSQSAFLTTHLYFPVPFNTKQ